MQEKPRVSSAPVIVYIVAAIVGAIFNSISHTPFGSGLLATVSPYISGGIQFLGFVFVVIAVRMKIEGKNKAANILNVLAFVLLVLGIYLASLSSVL